MVARDISDIVQDGGVPLGEESATSASKLNGKIVCIIVQCATVTISTMSHFRYDGSERAHAPGTVLQVADR